MSFSAHDTVHMTHALSLAREALFLTSPNPRVGCVLVHPNGDVIGSGHTQRAGEAHAEVMALRDAQAHQRDTRGATAYVTLEPCSHQGRTGPCCDALIHAGVSRVVVTQQDPNPQVAGQGIARLRAAGIQVDVGLLGGCSHAMRLFGHSRLRRMALTGMRVDGAELYRLGIVEACVPHEELMPTALAMAENIASKSPVSTRMIKHTLNVIEDMSLRDGYRYEQDMTAQIGQTEDAKEAQRAFAEKRAPVFVGR